MTRTLITLREYLEFVEAGPLLEGVVLSSPEATAAYAIVVAEAYDRAPVHDRSADPAWQALTRHTLDELFPQIERSGIKIQYSAEDPYGKYTDDALMQCRYMLWDMIVNRKLIIYTGHSDSHPVFEPETNVIFRTVHDYYTHGRMRSMFAKQIKALNLGRRVPTQEQLAELLPNMRLDQHGNVGHAFTLRGEMNAYVAHARLATKAAAPALFTEVVGQVCYKVIVGDFPTQKVAVLQDFDYFRVGVAHPGSSAATRMQAIGKEIMGGARAIKSSIAASPEVNIAALLAEAKRRN